MNTTSFCRLSFPLTILFFLFMLSTTADGVMEPSPAGATKCILCHFGLQNEQKTIIPFTLEPNARFMLHMWVEYAAFIIGIIAAGVITSSVIFSVVRRVGHIIHWRKELESDRKKRELKIRISFGEGVSVALGLLIAGEILSTIEAPSLTKLYVIALTVVIRTLVGLLVFLEEKRAEAQKNTASA